MPLMATGAILSGVGAIGNLAMGWNESNDAEEAMEDLERQMRKKQEFARERWQHYRDTYGDVEQQMVADAEEGVTGDFQGVTDRAAARVESEFASEDERQEREMARKGLDPSSGRYQSADRRMGLQRAVTSASEQNRAREKERRYADQATREMRQQVGSQGSQLMQNASQNLQQAQQGLAGLFSKQNKMHRQRASAAYNEAGRLGANAVMQGMSAASAPSANGQVGGGAPGQPTMDLESGNVDLFPNSGSRGMGLRRGTARQSPGRFSMGSGRSFGGMNNSDFYQGAY